MQRWMGKYLVHVATFVGVFCDNAYMLLCTLLTFPALFISLSEARNKQEEFATNIEKFLNLIQTLNDHKAELTDKVETLTIEKSTTESEMQDCSTKIEQLRQTINSQELSQEDVRRMEREKIRVEEQIGKQSSILEGQVAVLTEAQEKWNAIYKLLEQKVEEYNGKASQLELVPSKAKHAKGHIVPTGCNVSSAMPGISQTLLLQHNIVSNVMPAATARTVCCA